MRPSVAPTPPFPASASSLAPARPVRSPAFMDTPNSATPLLSNRDTPLDLPRPTRPARLLLLLLVAALALTIPAFFLLRSSHVSTKHRSLQTAVSPPSITLVALGDWGRSGQYGQTKVAAALSTVLTNVSTQAAILSTGDNFYQTGVTSPSDPQFNSSFEAVYSHLPLRTVPWYVVLGNHDHLGSISAQTAYTTRSQRWRMPAPYYTHRLTPHLLAIFLDTTPFVGGHYGLVARQVNAQKPHQQLLWLKSVLQNSDPALYFILVGHHNMYTMSTDDHLGTAEVRHQFEPLLKPYRKRILAYVSGHEHALMHMQPYPSNGYVVDHFLSGAGSKLHAIVEPEKDKREKWYKCCGVLPVRKPGKPRTVWGKSQHGFFTFKFDGVHFEAQAIDDEGSAIYTYHKTVNPI